jgi:transposase InsO family protein
MPPHDPRQTSPEALLRYAVISQVRAREIAGEKLVHAVHAVTGVQHFTLDGDLLLVGKRSIYRWLAAFRDRGMAGLEDAPRPRCEGSHVLDPSLLTFIATQKQADPRASLPEILRRARTLGVLAPDEKVDRCTVWRAARRLGLETKRRKKLRDRDSRRFMYPHRMQMLLCDGKHFRAGSTRARRVALFFLDDATRRGLHVVVGTSESTSLFLRGLYETVRLHGFMDLAYLDRGPGFASDDTGEVVARLGVAWILGEAGYPPARGAIERFNRTAEAALLRHFDGRPDVDPDCGALELRLRHWLRETYDVTPHEGLDGESPRARWEKDARPLRFPESDADLRARFVVHVTRRVSADHVVSFEGVDYEVPRGHAGEQVTLHHRLLSDTLAVLHEGRLVELAPVDLAANATAGRARPGKPVDDPEAILPPSAADLAFQRDFGPVVGPDGGFPATEE